MLADLIIFIMLNNPIYLIRHAESTFNAAWMIEGEPTFYDAGLVDAPLTDLGR